MKLLLNRIKQKLAFAFYHLDNRLVERLELKRETFFYWWSVELDVNNKIHRSGTSNDYLGL